MIVVRALAVIIAVPCGFFAGLVVGFAHGILVPNEVIAGGLLPLGEALVGAWVAGYGVFILLSPRRPA